MTTIFVTNEESLVRAFDLPRGVTALVGGGGKTTLMLKLARELAEAGSRVIVTTTTHIFPPDGITTLTNATIAEIASALVKDGAVCVGKSDGGEKLTAPDVSIGDLESLADYVLVEADGAKRFPLKAPAAHEPVIPDETRLVIAVAGLSGVGKTMREAVFRPERYAALTGKSESDPVTAQDVALVLTHPEGQRKGVTDDMRFSILLNQADDEAAKRAAAQVAAELNSTGVERTVVASMQKMFGLI